MGTASSIIAYIKCESCNSSIERSCMVDETCETLTIICTCCMEEHKIKNTFDQRSVMSKKPFRPIFEERVVRADQIGDGDVIGFKETMKKGVFDYRHAVLMIEWDKQAEAGKVIEVNEDPLRDQIEIRKVDIKLEELQNQLAHVARYKPMDCLYLKETLRRAKESNGKTFQKKQTILSNSFNFVSWCKSGSVKEKVTNKL